MNFQIEQKILAIEKALTFPLILLLGIGLLLGVISVFINPHYGKNQPLIQVKGLMLYFVLIVIVGIFVIGYIGGHNLGKVVFSNAFQRNSISMATGQIVNDGKVLSFFTGVLGGAGGIFLIGKIIQLVKFVFYFIFVRRK